MTVTARKRYGQHFLHDGNVIRRILDAIAPRDTDRFVEIGGGLGALSVPLAPRVGHLDVVEVDSRLAAELRTAFDGTAGVTVHEADALELDLAACCPTGDRVRIAGNLPYNISTQLLFRLMTFRSLILDMHCMLQKEVVDRMTAAPGSKAYGRLTVMLSRWFDIEACFDIRPGSFRPPPRVMSTLARITVREQPRFEVADEARFAALVAHLFSMRRKTLGRALRGRISADTLATLGIDASTRAETLSPARLAELADASR